MQSFTCNKYWQRQCMHWSSFITWLTQCNTWLIMFCRRLMYALNICFQNWNSATLNYILQWPNTLINTWSNNSFYGTLSRLKHYVFMLYEVCKVWKVKDDIDKMNMATPTKYGSKFQLAKIYLPYIFGVTISLEKEWCLQFGEICIQFFLSTKISYQ